MAKFTRKGLHRIVCDACDAFAYSTVAQLEQRGLPVCGWCQSPMRPEKIDLAITLGVEHPADDTIATDGYHREMSQVRALGGYQKAGERFSGIGGSVPTNMHERALDEFRKLERREARRRQVAALLPTVEAIPF